MFTSPSSDLILYVALPILMLLWSWYMTYSTIVPKSAAVDINKTQQKNEEESTHRTSPTAQRNIHNKTMADDSLQRVQFTHAKNHIRSRWIVHWRIYVFVKCWGGGATLKMPNSSLTRGKERLLYLFNFLKNLF